MKFIDREEVAGTDVTIGRKVQYRRDLAGNPTERVSKTYTAEYRDQEGNRHFQALGTPHKRDARRMALEIQHKLDDGRTMRKPGRLSMAGLIDRYTAFNVSKGLAPKTLAKYKSEAAKLRLFCTEESIEQASAFTEEVYHRFGAWLRSRTHKQQSGYATKTVYGTLTYTKQMFKWGKRQRLLSEDPIESASLPVGKARPQKCFTTGQVEAMLALCNQKPGWQQTHDAIAILAFTGLRVGELIQLSWSDVLLDRGELGVLHIRRGGSGETTKDKDERFVPIHPRVRPIFDALPRTDDLVMPGLRDRTLLGRIKRLCREFGYGAGYKTHSLRHHFVSMCASNGVPLRLCLDWVGHSSSEILNLYYTLHDHESESAMVRLAAVTRNGYER